MIDNYFHKITSTLERVDRESIQEVISALRNTHQSGGNIFVFGNGGSSATASHFTQDLNKMLGFRVNCLSDNTPSLLAYGNDINFVSIFKEQLMRVAKEGDVVIGISCSGQSGNIISAINWALDAHLCTIGLCGYDGGLLRGMVDYPLYVPSNDMQVCEDCHLIICHLILKLLQ